MVNSMHRSNPTQPNSKTNSLQNGSNNNNSNMSSDATNVTGNTQTANQSLASVRNRACAESTNSNISPQKAIKANSVSLDISSTHSSRDMKGRPKKPRFYMFVIINKSFI